MAGSLTGLPFYHKAFDLPVRPVLHTTTAALVLAP